MTEKIPLVAPNLSTILLDSSMNNAGRENILEMDLANSIPRNTTKKGLYLETYSAPAIPRKG